MKDVCGLLYCSIAYSVFSKGVILRLWITIFCVGFSSELQSKKRRVTKLKTIPMVKKYLVGDAASVAMDGVATELGQGDPLREKRHTRGTA